MEFLFDINFACLKDLRSELEKFINKDNFELFITNLKNNKKFNDVNFKCIVTESH